MSAGYKDLINELRRNNEVFGLFNTSRNVSYSSGKSYIFSGASQVFEPVSIEEIRDYINAESNLLGYISYEVKNQLEKLPETFPAEIDAPLMRFVDFDNVAEISGEIDIGIEHDIPVVAKLRSNMTKEEYLKKVEQCRKYIINGDVSQINLTRKFYGEFESEPDSIAIYLALNKASPAPYSAYVDFGDFQIISSSPELFLRSSKGEVVTCPIKGSAPSSDEIKLKGSLKDRAENLMITDLMRNDLSRVCKPGSIKVDNLFETNSYKTISHMHSEIRGLLEEDKDNVDLLKASFPPGSMTGTPKIHAIELISSLEGQDRGVYSGILGYLRGGDFMEFSVVIRTLIVKGRKFEFQVGGAIVYDSEAEKEWQETMNKAAGIAEVLGVKKMLEAI
jgi:para-aminobenzoate synthetase component 1